MVSRWYELEAYLPSRGDNFREVGGAGTFGGDGSAVFGLALSDGCD